MSLTRPCPPVCPPISPIVCEPIVIVRDHYVPQIVPVIHPIQVIDKVHCVPVEQHIYTYTEGEAVAAAAVSGKASRKSRKAKSRSKR